MYLPFRLPLDLNDEKIAHDSMPSHSHPNERAVIVKWYANIIPGIIDIAAPKIFTSLDQIA